VRGSVSAVLALLVLGLVLFGAMRLWRTSDRGRLCALSAVLPVAAASLVWLAGPDVYVVKNLIGAAPFAAVAIVAALTALPRPLAMAATASAAALVVAGFLGKSGRLVPDYDLVAAALVQQGWTDKDPILVFGPQYQLLHPLDWYLPGHRLEIARWTGKTCERVYVVSVGGWRAALTAGAVTGHIRRIVIGYAPYWPGLPREARDGGGHLLATRAAKCASVA
jgi:hypothetical protein